MMEILHSILALLLYPIRKLFSFIYLRSRWLQAIFSYRLCDESFNINQVEVITNIDTLAASLGLAVEHHEVQSIDGYVLGMQRLSLLSSDGKNKDGSSRSSNNSPTGVFKGSILLLHGTLQDSESFLCSGSSSLALVLCQAGYDVWLGNNRGTKYSRDHETLDKSASHYWDFSVDDMAMFDFPAMINHILRTTKRQKICFVGFSQGASLALVSLSLNPELCKHLSVCITLGAALRPHPDRRTVLHSFFRFHYILSTFVLQKVFGDRSVAALGIVIKNALSPKMFCQISSLCGYWCIGWRFKNISLSRRQSLFQFTFSETSVKCALQWMQFDRLEYLSHYNHHFFPSNYFGSVKYFLDHYAHRFHISLRFLWPYCGSTTNSVANDSSNVTSSNVTHQLTPGKGRSRDPFRDYQRRTKECDLSRITCPVGSLCGLLDGIVDPYAVQRLVPTCIFNHIEPEYEHLDMIWADDVKKKIFPLVLGLLKQYRDL